MTDNYKSDLSNEDEKLSDYNFYNGTKVLVQTGKALRHGEILCKYILYDINTETKTELFELALPSKNTLLEIKTQLVKYFAEQQSSEQTKKKYPVNFTFPTNPEQLRIRHMLGQRCSSVHPNAKLLKDIIQKYHNPPEVFLSILPENEKEDKVSDDLIVIILRQFHPESYDIGTALEITANKDEKIIDIKTRIASLIGIPLERLSMAPADNYDLQNLLRLPKLHWYPRPDEDKKDHYKQKYSDILDPDRPLRSLMLEDGSILLYRDLTVARKVLTDTEERKIMEDEDKKRMMKYRINYHRKEENLDIKITEVSLDIPQKKT